MSHEIRNKYSDEMIRYTLEFLQPRSPRQLTEDDAVVSLDNIIGFFRILIKWDEEDRRRKNDTENSE